MPMSKAGRKIMANLKKEYGDKKGEGIFYAMENKGEIPGMNMGGMAGLTPAQRKEVRAARRASRKAARQKNMVQGTSGPKPINPTVRGTSGPKPINPAINNQMAKGGMAMKGYAEGGMVKSTGKLNTGIRKCGE